MRLYGKLMNVIRKHIGYKLKNHFIIIGLLSLYYISICLITGCGSDMTNHISMNSEESSYQQKASNAKGALDLFDVDCDTISDIALDTIPEITPVKEPEIISITISAAGDVTLGNTQNQGYAGTFRQMYDKQEPAYFLKNVKEIFENDDMTLVNFEGVLTFADEKMEKEYNMKGDPEYIKILPEGAVDAVSFGNNHRMDYLQVGCDDTVEAFKAEGIPYAYDQFLGIYEVKGIKIGFVSVNEVYEHEAVEVNLSEGIQKLREDEGCNLVIACCHWGIEGDHYPNDYQKELSRKCIDWGADLVLGSHPHVLQGIDMYDGKFIIYSLSNFCFGGNKNPKDKDSMIYQQTFTFIDGVKQEDAIACVIPCQISSVQDRNDFCPTPVSKDEYKRILKRINQYSEPFAIKFDQEGKYISNTEQNNTFTDIEEP